MMPAFNSLAGRLLLASAILLPLFLGATALYLDQNHQRSLETAQSQRLQLQVLTLLAEAEFDGRFTLPESLVEARFNRPDSGLYAFVTDENYRTIWSSPSAMSIKDSLSTFAASSLAVGERDFVRGNEYFQYSYQVVWETESGREAPLMFTVLESIAAVENQVDVYRRGLFLWLAGATLLLIGVQAIILFWGLRPLRHLADEISAIEAGAQEDLMGAYPNEVQGITDSLSTLLLSEKKRRDRARNTLSDLAHSLKTPLAVIRSADTSDPDYPDLVNEQTSQMEQTVSYQLQRAVGASHKLLQMVPVAPVATRLQSSLLKVYADKGVSIELDASAESVFQGDERDLLELMGIIMDNACKYGRKLVRVSVSGGGAAPLLITVEDDGNGIPESMRKAIFRRGVRADSQQSGHGIGLAVAADLAESYLGTLELAQSCMGGAHLRVAIP